MKKNTAWILSMFLSLALISILILLWIKMNRHEEVYQDNFKPGQSRQLVNNSVVKEYLNKALEQPSSYENVIKIKTGIFIQSLSFSNSNEVNITGYIWQHYNQGLRDSIQLDAAEVGFILPEQVNTGADIEPREVYRFKKGENEVVGWYFEATLRQPFNYSNYPFDHKIVWIRLWPKKFLQNVVLVPDLESYAGTGLTDIFGIEQNIVLGTWERMNTYFDYKLSNYSTNFGIDDSRWQDSFPELHYNFVIKRKIESAFIVYLLPLFLVASLLFAALLTISKNDQVAQQLGFNTFGFISASSALFFVVLLSHIQLRQQFEGTDIVYIEYFYLMMYVLLVLATANTYIFSLKESRYNNLILYEDNLIPKVLYWPLILACMIGLTLIKIYTY